jgi:TolB-like protein
MRRMLANAVESFLNAKKGSSEETYFKGLSEGIMQALRKADLLSSEEIKAIVSDAELKFKDAYYDTPTYRRLDETKP